MATPYSKRIMAGHVTAATGLQAICPTGSTWIISDIVALASATGCSNPAVILPGVAFIWGLAGLSLRVNEHWVGHQVINSGEEIQGVCDAGDFYLTVSGYQLQGSAPP